MRGNFLINTEDWFIAPDGKQYKCAYGHAEVMDATEMLGIKTNARSTNWYVRVGKLDEDYIVIAGCQIHYAIKCENPNRSPQVDEWSSKDGEYKQFKSGNRIYFPKKS